MNSTLRRVALAIALSLTLVAPDLAVAGVGTPIQFSARGGVTMPGVELAHSQRYKRLKPGCRAVYCKPGYRYAKYKKWQRKKYFGRIVAGVTLGVVIVTAANAAPRRPESDLCWYWANTSRTKGYWDYCY